MIESFQQQQQMSVLELYVEKDVAGGSMFHAANSVTSCGRNVSHHESELPRNISNLHDDEDDDDDDYLASNSYVEESFDEDDSDDGISDTDDEVTDIVEPVSIVHPTEDKNGICLISDCHASIKSAVANEHLGWQPPHGYHVYCVRHIASNFNRKFNNAKQKEMFKKLGKVLRDCRSIPITALVKSTYSRCRKYFVDRGRQAQRQLREGQVYCSKLVIELRKNQEQACSHIVRVYDIHSTRFEVEETFNPITQRGGQKWAVNLNGHYCQCRRYSALHYPCSHIIAACGYVSMNYYQYIDVVYTNEHILKAYSAQWWPFGNEAAIPPSDEAWTLIPDPTTIRAKGRLKSTRIRNEMDWVEPSDH
ncbi:hypothetical protein GmHk_02G005223 [Glycine max]|nr:hypothetical protein GmHk_02G005223 [Glycine max]